MSQSALPWHAATYKCPLTILPYLFEHHVKQSAGLLYIDIIDAASKKLVWQGKGTGSLSKGSPQEREERILSFVTEILGAYPPNTSK